MLLSDQMSPLKKLKSTELKIQIQIQQCKYKYKFKDKYNISGNTNTISVHSSFVRSWREQCHRIRLWSRYHGHALIRLNKRNLWFLTFIFGWSLLLESFLDIYFLAETNLGHAMSPESKNIADYRFDSIGCFIPFQSVLFFVSVIFYFIFLYV